MREINVIHCPLLHNSVASNINVNANSLKYSVHKTIYKSETLLTYNATWERLKGFIGDQYFDEKVYSGGSRGHQMNVKDSIAELNLYHEAFELKSWSPLTKTLEAGTKDKKKYLQRGGTIPPGHYECVYLKHYTKFKKECIRLNPKDDAKVVKSPFFNKIIEHGRGGFYIHGSGPEGSDGCLVFNNKEKWQEFNKAIRDFHGNVILEVINDGFYLVPSKIDEQFNDLA